MLAFVLVDTFDLNIEKGFGVHVHTGPQLQERGEVAFRSELYLAPALLEVLVVRHGLQLSKFVKVEQPPVSNLLGDEAGERAIAESYKAPGCHAIGNVAKLLRPQLGEIVHHRLLEQIRMQPGDTVDAMAAHSREMGHAHESLAGFTDERH